MHFNYIASLAQSPLPLIRDYPNRGDIEPNFNPALGLTSPGQIVESRAFGPVTIEITCTLYVYQGLGFFTIDRFKVIDPTVV